MRTVSSYEHTVMLAYLTVLRVPGTVDFIIQTLIDFSDHICSSV